MNIYDTEVILIEENLLQIKENNSKYSQYRYQNASSDETK